jgi:hypothetical protein
MEGRVRALVENIIPAFAWKNWGKLKKIVSIIHASDAVHIKKSAA